MALRPTSAVVPLHDDNLFRSSSVTRYGTPSGIRSVVSLHLPGNVSSINDYKPIHNPELTFQPPISSPRFRCAARRSQEASGGSLSRLICPAAVDNAREPLSSATTDPSNSEDWDSARSAALYRIDGWSGGYFSVNDQGDVVACVDGNPQGSASVSLMDVIQAVRERQPPLQLPAVIRFPDILESRIREINACFEHAMERFDYKSPYRGVFPIKCHPDRQVVQDMVQFGRPFGFGLEVGSKAELIIAMAAMDANTHALLICNGYKDKQYIEAALLARQLGIPAVIVLEKIHEVHRAIAVSSQLGVRPVLGVRAKLSSRHEGVWGGTSGEKAKFGLTVSEVVELVGVLEKAGMLDCLQLLHFHVGSQIPSISKVKEAMREGSHLYCELALMGAKMGHIDVGGGLGLDYDGSNGGTDMSINYNMQSYANDIIAALSDACLMKGVPHPIVTSESGRALSSHHSVVVFEVLNGSTARRQKPPSQQQELERSILGSPDAAECYYIESDNTQSRGSMPSAANVTASPGAEEGDSRSSATISAVAETNTNSSGSDSFNSSSSSTNWATTNTKRSSSSSSSKNKGSGRSDTRAADFLLSTFAEVLHTMDGGNFQEALNDARQFKKEAGDLFKLGCMSLTQRAQVEVLYERVLHQANHLHSIPPHISTGPPFTSPSPLTLPPTMYHINLSIFRSAPDVWNIGQVFPVLPVHRLNERPCVPAVLADLTCDSYGKIDKFMGCPWPRGDSLALHEVRNGQEPYYLGLFLAGAYQDIMGCPHNLFGSTAVVTVRLLSQAHATTTSCSSNDATFGSDGGNRRDSGIDSSQVIASSSSSSSRSSSSDGSSSSISHGYITGGSAAYQARAAAAEPAVGVRFFIEHVAPQQTVARVVEVAGYDGANLLAAVETKVRSAAIAGSLQEEEAKALVEKVTACLQSSTYYLS